MDTTYIIPAVAGRLYTKMPSVITNITRALTMPARYRDGAKRIRIMIGGIFQSDRSFRYLTAQNMKKIFIRVIVY